MSADPHPELESTVPALPCWQARLPDASEVMIRPLLPEDHFAEDAFLASLGHAPRVDEDVGNRVDVAFVAVSSRDQDQLLGMARSWDELAEERERMLAAGGGGDQPDAPRD